MKKIICLLLLAFIIAPTAFASWDYNENGGFGIYLPDGWSSTENGRSTQLTGPTADSAQSKIFLGSDWVSHVNTIDDLENYVRTQVKNASPTKVQNSGLDGFSVGNELVGKMFFLRQAENVIVVEYQLRGSSDQKDEGKTALGSIEIRTKGNNYP